MKLHFTRSWLPVGLLLLTLGACVEDQAETTVYHYAEDDYKVLTQVLNLPEEPLPYQAELPAHLRTGGFTTNVDNDMATLGRVLFYDTNLSKSKAVSCASCHEQAKGFSDDVAFSEGHMGEMTDRNSLALGSFVSFRQYYNTVIGVGRASFFWDERAQTLEQQADETLRNAKEMGMDMNTLASRLNDEPHYPILFQKAFGDTHIDGQRVSTALSEFVNALTSAESKFDEGHAAMGAQVDPYTDFPNFTEEENIGKNLFMDHCASCHAFSLSPFMAASFNLTRTVANTGLDITYADKGLSERTGFDQDRGKFKIPLLRNVALTGPYMHDGRFETLEEVVDFYNDEVENHANLDELMRDPSDGSVLELDMSDSEKRAMVAFMKTFTDQKMLTKEQFSDPFK